MESSAVRIVVVDDVVDVADTLAMQLTLDGYDVATAYAANDAIQRIEAHQPHCVLPDISMPDIDGYELATLLRHRYKDDIVLIAVTGSSEQEARVSDAFAVVDHYFQTGRTCRAEEDFAADSRGWPAARWADRVGPPICAGWVDRSYQDRPDACVQFLADAAQNCGD